MVAGMRRRSMRREQVRTDVRGDVEVVGELVALAGSIASSAIAVVTVAARHVAQAGHSARSFS